MATTQEEKDTGPYTLSLDQINQEGTEEPPKIDIKVENNFIDAQPRGFLDMLFGSFEDIVAPPGSTPGFRIRDYGE